MIITNSTRKTMATGLINQLIGVVAKFNAIVKIRKYRGIHERHHFIPMDMQVHGAFKRDIDNFIREFVCLFHSRI